MQRKSARERGVGGAGRYQCLVRSGGVPSRKFEANRGERKKRVVEKQWRSRRLKIKTILLEEKSSPLLCAVGSLACSTRPQTFPPFLRAAARNFTKRGEEFFETKRLPEESGPVALEKNNKKEVREARSERAHERQSRLLNEINEKQRSAGGFNPL